MDAMNRSPGLSRDAAPSGSVVISRGGHDFPIPPADRPLPISALLGLKLAPRGPSYTLVKLLEGMQSAQTPVTLYAPFGRWPSPLPFAVSRDTVNRLATSMRAPYRRLSGTLGRRNERRLLADRRVTPKEGPKEGVVFTWGEVSLQTSRALARSGNLVVREKFNCAKAVARDILTHAYDRFGMPPPGLTDALIDKELEELSLADAIFCPSPMVARSLRAIGIPEDRLLETSYGWEAARFAGDDRALPPQPGLTLLFVGSICVRKGAHLLLEAWERAGVRGRLVLVGNIEDVIRERYGSVLARDDVTHVPYTNNVAAYFRSADWFVFPSLEEGGPQVTYEAAGCGVPSLVSPMGAGAFCRDGIEGIVVDSPEVKPWADAIRALPDRAQDRDIFAENAERRAQEFTYQKVGAKRRDLLLERFASPHG